jgi:hypothetical protein
VFFQLSHVCYMPRQSNPHWFYPSNIICWRVQTMNLKSHFWSSSLHSSPQASVTSSNFGPNCPQRPQSVLSPGVTDQDPNPYKITDKTCKQESVSLLNIEVD